MPTLDIFYEELIYVSLIIILLTMSSYLVAKNYLPKLLNNIVGRKQPKWKTVLEKRKTFNQLVYMVPTLFIYFWIQYYPEASTYVNRILNCYIIINIILLMDNILATASDIYNFYPMAKKKPIKSYIQLVNIFIYIVGGVVSLCMLLDKSPWGFLSSIGALTAVLLLVFRDTILSFIASMQIVANNLIQPGDCIEVPAFGADGDVIDVALHVVKVQNWDKTIVTIPTYKLIEGGFKNWRGMFDAGGRRIKRALFIDQTSVKILSSSEIHEIRQKEIIQLTSNKTKPDNLCIDSYLGGKGQLETGYGDPTNLGIFRNYVEAYLKNHPKISDELTFIIRLLDPTASGIPLEVYVFSTDTRWSAYEKIQAEIFEHLLAMLPQFHLRIFQNPTGHDFYRLGDAHEHHVAHLQQTGTTQP